MRANMKLCLCVLVFVYVYGTAVPRRSPAEFPPENSLNDGALPTGTLLHHSDLITSTHIQSHTHISVYRTIWVYLQLAKKGFGIKLKFLFVNMNSYLTHL